MSNLLNIGCVFLSNLNTIILLLGKIDTNTPYTLFVDVFINILPGLMFSMFINTIDYFIILLFDYLIIWFIIIM